MVNDHSLAYGFFENIERNPDKTALVNNGRHITYRRLGQVTEQYISLLQSNHLLKGDTIGALVSDSIDFSALMFACAALGLSLVPMDPTTPEELITKRFEQLGVRYRVSSIGHASETVIDYPELDGNETFIISMTSGSTNEPKPIELTQNIKAARAKAHIDLYHLDQDDVILASTPLYHSLSERLVIISLLLGATCVIMDDFKAYEWFNLVNRENVTFTICDSSQLSQISQLLLSPFVPEISSLRTIVSSSSYLESHIRKQLIDHLDCDFHEIYGTSETSTITDIDLKEDRNIHSVGKPLKQAKIMIDDPDENQIGEILCSSELNFKGYYKNDELTQKSFSDGYFRTGDLGKIDENGYLYFCGRKDELIKSGGINIYPFDIEETLMSLEGIRECAVFTYPDDIKGNVIALAAVTEENSDLSKETIGEYCETHLARPAVPEYIFILKELPKNSMGKIRKNKIYERIIVAQMTGEVI